VKHLTSYGSFRIDLSESGGLGGGRAPVWCSTHTAKLARMVGIRVSNGAGLVAPPSLNATRNFRLNLANQDPGEVRPAGRRRTGRSCHLCGNRKRGAVPSVTDRDVADISIAVESQAEAFSLERQ
jgi:hypothetical protein